MGIQERWTHRPLIDPYIVVTNNLKSKLKLNNPAHRAEAAQAKRQRHSLKGPGSAKRSARGSKRSIKAVHNFLPSFARGRTSPPLLYILLLLLLYILATFPDRLPVLLPC